MHAVTFAHYGMHAYTYKTILYKSHKQHKHDQYNYLYKVKSNYVYNATVYVLTVDCKVVSGRAVACIISCHQCVVAFICFLKISYGE